MTQTTAGAVLETLAGAIAARDWTGLRATLSDRVVVGLVHTDETLDADGFVALNRDYPGEWTYHLDDVVDAGDRAVLRSHTVIGDQTWHAASFATLDDDGLVAELVEVWSEAVGPAPGRTVT